MENIETLLAAVAQTQGFDDDPVAAPAPPSSENSDSRGAVRPIGEGSVNAQPPAAVAPPPPPIAASEQVIGAGEKRKRGRPPKGQVAVARTPPPKRKKLEEEEEEDVCFLCFDGGSLVLCDRKGCPKAYHPACIKREESFFKSKAKWNCGWHICSVCRKASHYMCYTCTYSLCKGCTKNQDYVSVRGNKGFCSMCMKMVMLIENKDQANNEPVQVDFDDKLSWEYLFKVYWVILKEKLSLTLNELTQAKSPWKGVADVPWKPQLNNVPHTAFDGKVSNSSTNTEHLTSNTPHAETNLPQNDELRPTPSGINNIVDKVHSNNGESGPRCNNDTSKPDMDKANDETGFKKDEDKMRIVDDNSKKGICDNTDTKEPDKTGTEKCTEWASKDLLEFVAFLRNGDTSAMSPFDVQRLLLDYIKRNNLRDPRQKSQIICDQRLKNLFLKPRVGHIEMLKLLEFHFPMTEGSQDNNLIPAGFVATAPEIQGSSNTFPSSMNSRKRKTRKRNEERVPQNNLNEYAAIDVHNISLIYLRRHIMENLLQDQESFGKRVIGSIVRIRTSSNDQKQDIYRLVQVVGTTKAPEPYKLGERTALVMLEILNLYKKEVVSIDAISNQEFTEEECRRLRQSMRCGLVKLLTIGELQKIALTLRPVKIKDWLEAEILRLNHLRDRASENGRKKELREYVDRLELLKSPGEQQRRISELPQIHADPKMCPSYESEEEEVEVDDDKPAAKRGRKSRKAVSVRPSYSSFSQNGRNPASLNKKGAKEPPIAMRAKKDANGAHTSDKPAIEVNITNLKAGGKNDQDVQQRTGLETSTTTASVEHSPANNIETEKLWHYRDPNGKIQGPFSMLQLRKWNRTGLFPPDMRIWTNHEQYDSLLLMDALIGHLHGASEPSCKQPSGSPENNTAGGVGKTKISDWNSQQSKQSEAAGGNNVGDVSDNISGIAKENADDPSWPQCWDLLNDRNSTAEERNRGQTDVPLAVQVLESNELNCGTQNGEKNELQNQGNSENQTAQPNEENLKSLNIDLSSTLMETEAIVAPVSDAPDVEKRVLDVDIDIAGLHSPTPENAENQALVSGILELLSPTPRSDNVDAATEAKQPDLQSEFLNITVPDSGPSWGVASSLVAGGVDLPDVANEWCGYSPTPIKQPAINEWDSGLASVSSLKPEITNEYTATSISDGHQLSQALPPDPASNMSNWRELLDEPIVFDALGEELISDLFAEVDARESQGTVHSPNTAIKLARDFLEDDCFSSIEDFNPTPNAQRCVGGGGNASGSTGEMQMTSQSSCNPIEMFDTFDSFRKSSVNSSASSEGETNAQVYSGDAGSEFHPPPNINPGHDMIGHAVTTATSSGSADPMDPGWAGTVQGNINLVTVQGNVNLVLGGPTQGMANLGWGASPGTAWANPSMNHSPRNMSLPWDGVQQQRKYGGGGGERYTSPRGGYQSGDVGFGRGRPPRGRQPYNGGGFSRPLPKGQRVCKFYERGLCKKGAFCDFLHPS
ncbi:zinc finger CCCH domain-containing protein 44 [Andrographis paniculata]|uniref:zinc finger CCCH domain-containing protein 44 n=1 Tax=Andrographis paniculata TaxID=175694 RepID=UPI0021E98D96|nr:zinc finger CCCH domain-containing protein 44 [Andrographis paniculata]